MDMYYCDNCGEIFEEPEQKEISFEEYFGVDNLFGSRHRTTINICPHCGNEPVEEAQQCAICEEWFNPDVLEDTEGYINGGCGYCCEGCIEDSDMIRI